MRGQRLPWAEARRQAPWIAAMDPWRSLGYQSAPLARYLGRKAKAGQAWGVFRAGETLAVMVLCPDFLLGSFISLLAVKAQAKGQGLGRALVELAEAKTAPRRKWLYVSSDSQNRAASLFYRRLGFKRVGRLPDLVAEGHTEILWRKAVRGVE